MLVSRGYTEVRSSSGRIMIGLAYSISKLECALIILRDILVHNHDSYKNDLDITATSENYSSCPQWSWDLWKGYAVEGFTGNKDQELRH